MATQVDAAYRQYGKISMTRTLPAGARVFLCLYLIFFTIAEPRRAKRWREAPDSWVGTQRRAIVAPPSRRAVGAKNTSRARRHLAQGMCQVFTEGRGTTFATPVLSQSKGYACPEPVEGLRANGVFQQPARERFSYDTGLYSSICFRCLRCGNPLIHLVCFCARDVYVINYRIS